MRDERELIQACIAGEPAAWDEFVQRFDRLIYSIPRRLGLSATDADDVFQIVCGIVLRRLETLRDEARVSAWLVRVTYRESWRILRRRSPTEPLASAEQAADDPGEDEVLRAEQQHLVRQALATLDARCRALLTALFFQSEAARYEDVARTLGIPIGSIGPTRARCLQKMQSLLARPLVRPGSR